MIKFKINGQEYFGASGWEDITLGQAADLLRITMPDSLKDVYKAASNPDGLPSDKLEEKIEEAQQAMPIHEQFKEIPRYYSKVIECLSNVPGDLMAKVDVISIKTMYQAYFRQFAEGLHFFPHNYQPVDIKYFDFDGVRYFLPVDRKIFGQPVPMVDVTALEFTESADLLIASTAANKEQEFGKVANMIAILCRPDGEKYDEAVSLARAEKFRALPMSTVWAVFFSLLGPLIILGQYALISSLEQVTDEIQKPPKNSEPSGGMAKSCSWPVAMLRRLKRSKT